MKPFQALTRSGQIARYRSFAEQVLQHYDLDVQQIVPLHHALNTTFRVDGCQYRQGKSVCRRFVLRIQQPALRSSHMIRSELHWLRAIAHDTELIIPRPILNTQRKFITTESIPGIPEPRHGVLFEWVYGIFFRSQLGVAGLEQAGTFLANLHNHTASYSPPTWFTRKRWDFQGLLGEALDIDSKKSHEILSTGQRQVLESIADRLKHVIQRLGEGPDVFGLIHGDFQEANYLFLNQKIRAIDFDSCGWGYYLYDIGVTFSTLQHLPNFPALRSAFLRGYRSIRPLSPEHEECIQTFIGARLLGNVLLLAHTLHEPGNSHAARIRINHQITYLSNLLGQSNEFCAEDT